MIFVFKLLQILKKFNIHNRQVISITCDNGANIVKMVRIFNDNEETTDDESESEEIENINLNGNYNINLYFLIKNCSLGYKQCLLVL